MGKRISKSVVTHELEPASLSELIHQHVRVAIETAVQNPVAQLFSYQYPTHFSCAYGALRPGSTCWSRNAKASRPAASKQTQVDGRGFAGASSVNGRSPPALGMPRMVSSGPRRPRLER